MRWSFVFLVLACVGCEVDVGVDAGELDAASDATSDATFDGTGELEDCAFVPGGIRLCAPLAQRQGGRWNFRFACPRTSIWRVELNAASDGTTLAVDGLMGRSYGVSDSPGTAHRILFTSLEDDGACVATVMLAVDTAFDLSIEQIEPPLSPLGCDELCLLDTTTGAERGCDCAGICRDACTDGGVDCGLPCNSDSPFYACPFLEGEIRMSNDCAAFPDGGNFEHVGDCYRCGDGQQCCYTDGRDNGTGSYDICPPSDPGPNDPDPHDCSGIFDHCDCDVTPLCGCMAESGALELCGECIGEDNLSLSCNAPGDDGTFCVRAAAAATAGFSWCAVVGDPDRCFDLPPGF